MTPTAIGSLTAAQQKADAADAAATAKATPEQRKAARDFEAIFLRQLMAPLEKSSGLSGGESSGGQVFRSMMVSALADTASEGGGIGMSELILKAMMPPAPQEKPDLSLHAGSPHAGSPHTLAPPSAAAAAAASTDATGERDGPSGVHHGSLGEPGGSSRWGSSSRVLTSTQRAPMLGVATGAAASTREGNHR
ncbi:MAG TPA: rod-binding protein [Polyangiaceae bacterium]|nr:rod-binding protein [Polyangiaceae bacterium]